MQEDGKKKAKGVAVSTIHSAKGLEWDKVFTVQVVDGCLPMDFRPPSGEQPLAHTDATEGVGHARPSLAVSPLPAEPCTPYVTGNNLRLQCRSCDDAIILIFSRRLCHAAP